MLSLIALTCDRGDMLKIEMFLNEYSNDLYLLYKKYR